MRPQPHWTALPLALAAVTCMVMACARETSTEPLVPATAPQLVQLGWYQFDRGEFELAADAFSQAIALDSQHAPAHLGLGCARLRTADDAAALQAALTSCNAAISLATSDDGRAVRAATRLALGDFAGARDDAAAVIASAPAFECSHWPELNAPAVLVVHACASVGLGQYTQALAQLGTLRPRPLSADDPDTWIVDGTRYSTFEAAVIALTASLAAATTVDAP